LRRPLPPGPRQPPAAGAALDAAAAGPSRDPARRGGDRGLAGRALAGASSEAQAEGRTLVWVDESGFYLLPGAVRTYAPAGRTPVLRVPLSRDHLAVISGVTPAGRLLMLVQEHPYKSPDIVRFLKHLLRHI